jgi:hypothetical protein
VLKTPVTFRKFQGFPPSQSHKFPSQQKPQIPQKTQNQFINPNLKISQEKLTYKKLSWEIEFSTEKRTIQPPTKKIVWKFFSLRQFP